MTVRCAVLSEYPGYVLTSDGRVQGPSGKWLKGSTLKRCGHVQIVRRTWNQYVHRLVALAFLGDPPSPEHEVRHLNGDPSDNRVENLLWSTHAENMADTVYHGTSLRGERNPQAKLTEDQVRSIRAEYVPGEVTYRQLADKYGVSTIAIHDVVNRARWGWLE